jgi:hypothetical protein
MMILDKKKALMTIMSKRNDGSGETTSAPMQSEVVKSEDGEIDGRHAAAQDIMAAIHEKSPAKLMEAMANFYDLHMSRKMEPESEESEEKE